jgi:hypothetical protein
MGYIEECYRKWLLDKVLVECWTTLKCAKVLNRSLKRVNEDLKKFVEEVKVG